MNLCTLFAVIGLLLLQQVTVTAQNYKAGDKLEAFINNSWKEVVVVKSLPGKNGVYEVKETGTANKGAAAMVRSMGRDQLRFSRQAQAVAVTGVSPLHLGRYEIYAGVPSIYLGHMILQENGRYKVAFDNDADNYDEMGRYEYHPETNSVEWKFGLFRNNNWGGKLVKLNEKTWRIEFTSTTYAESK